MLKLYLGPFKILEWDKSNREEFNLVFLHTNEVGFDQSSSSSLLCGQLLTTVLGKGPLKHWVYGGALAKYYV